MQRNEITNSLESILKSQEKVTGITRALTKRVRNALDIRDSTEAFNLERDLKRISRIQREFARYFNELEIVRISRHQRAERDRQRWKIIN